MAALVAGLLSVLFLAGCSPEVTPTVTPSAGHGPDTTRTSVTIESSVSATASPQPDTSASTSTTVSPQVLEPQFGESTRPQPGTVTLTDAAKAFVPPATMPLYRIVATPITDVAMKELADRLGMAADRRYSFDESPGLHSWVNDGEWSLMFFRNDLDCFHLIAPDGDREATSAFERGEDVRAVSSEGAIASAQEYLTALGYREGLGQPEAFVRTSMGRSGGGQPDVNDVVITRGVSYPVKIGGLRLIDAGVTVDVAPGGHVIAFSHTVQQEEPDEVEVPILSVEKAAEDV